ncbi:hypothetical protein [Vibrio owensii]|uniref:Uncharacterized protein n=1 Tax=Vibrio owensii CAIM 1854 = LMG 25443 TaxID=1229493 RepID=A0A0C1VTJ8_9VIBR|nr:hypothetical protein [Vibrio owensii]KIF53233.1 hypothetical protein H735_09900 [Vibrio owensii CAIM 1854 = LMG 25443]
MVIADTSDDLQILDVPDGATHHHTMGRITLFYKREDLYRANDGRKWMLWSEKCNRWVQAMVNTVHVQANGLPHGFATL